MTSRDAPSLDPDDWFADPDRAPSRRARTAGADDWIADEPRARRAPGQLAGYLPERWLPIGAGLAVLVVALIAWFALSGGSSSPTQATTTNHVSSTPTTPVTTPAAPTVPAPATTLKPGDTGAQVKRLQRALASLGYTVGKVDGDYGTSTKSALAAFQTAQKLTSDGVFGPATRAAMIAALNGG